MPATGTQALSCPCATLGIRSNVQSRNERASIRQLLTARGHWRTLAGANRCATLHLPATHRRSFRFFCSCSKNQTKKEREPLSPPSDSSPNTVRLLDGYEQQHDGVILSAALTMFGTFGLLGLDVAYSHVLSPFDKAMHSFISQNVPVETQEWSEHVVSMWSIDFSLVGVVLCSGFLLLNGRIRRPITALALHVVAGFPPLPGTQDAIIVTTFKALFGRLRPCAELHVIDNLPVLPQCRYNW